MSFSDILFYLFSAVLLIGAVRVVLARSPVVAVLHLILCFFTASCLWFIIGSEFLALLLIVVYVGAVMVLFLFVVMMIDVLPESKRHDVRRYVALGGVLAVIMMIELALVIFKGTQGVGALNPLPDGYNNVLALGTELYSKYYFHIQVGGLILLVGMVSAIALTMRPRQNAKWTQVSKQLKVRATDRLTVVKMAAEVDLPVEPEAPAEEAAAEPAKEAPKAEAKPADKPAEKAPAKEGDKAAEKAADKPAEKAADKPADKPAEAKSDNKAAPQGDKA